MRTRVVAISHTTGAGGRTIGHAVATRLNYRYIDEEIITLAAKKENVDAAVVADAERRKTFFERLFSGLAVAIDPPLIGGGVMMADAVSPESSMRTLIVAAIQETAEQGDAVIVSHAASIPLTGRADVLRVFVTASLATRVQRVADAGGQKDPAKFIADNDAARAEYFHRFYQIERELPTHYDLVINTDAVGLDDAAHVIVLTAQRRR
jgi:cytidylate kinase